MDASHRRRTKVAVTAATYAAVAAAVVTVVSDGLRAYFPYVAAVTSVLLVLFALVWTQGGSGGTAGRTARLALVFGILGITVMPLAGGVLAWVLARRARRLAAVHGASYPAWMATTAQVLAIGAVAKVGIGVAMWVAR